MVDGEKISAAANQAAAHAAELAAKLKDRVGVAADEVITRAGPVAAQAATRVTELATKAGSAAAGQVDGVAAGVKKATGGKGADRIDSISAALKKALDSDPGPS